MIGVLQMTPARCFAAQSSFFSRLPRQLISRIDWYGSQKRPQFPPQASGGDTWARAAKRGQPVNGLTGFSARQAPPQRPPYPAARIRRHPVPPSRSSGPNGSRFERLWRLRLEMIAPHGEPIEIGPAKVSCLPVGLVAIGQLIPHVGLKVVRIKKGIAHLLLLGNQSGD